MKNVVIGDCTQLTLAVLLEASALKNFTRCSNVYTMIRTNSLVPSPVFLFNTIANITVCLGR